jgi:hypothetical protein
MPKVGSVYVVQPKDTLIRVLTWKYGESKLFDKYLQKNAKKISKSQWIAPGTRLTLGADGTVRKAGSNQFIVEGIKGLDQVVEAVNEVATPTPSFEVTASKVEVQPKVEAQSISQPQPSQSKVEVAPVPAPITQPVTQPGVQVEKAGPIGGVDIISNPHPSSASVSSPSSISSLDVPANLDASDVKEAAVQDANWALQSYIKGSCIGVLAILLLSSLVWMVQSKPKHWNSMEYPLPPQARSTQAKSSQVKPTLGKLPQPKAVEKKVKLTTASQSRTKKVETSRLKVLEEKLEAGPSGPQVARVIPITRKPEKKKRAQRVTRKSPKAPRKKSA